MIGGGAVAGGRGGDELAVAPVLHHGTPCLRDLLRFESILNQKISDEPGHIVHSFCNAFLRRNWERCSAVTHLLRGRVAVATVVWLVKAHEERTIDAVSHGRVHAVEAPATSTQPHVYVKEAPETKLPE